MEAIPLPHAAAGQPPRHIRHRRWASLIVASLALAVTGRISAQSIIPSAVEASSFYAADQAPENLINGSGLSAGTDDSLRTHTVHPSGWQMWHSNGGPVTSTWLVFDLGTQHTVTGIRVWNMNQTNLTGRGIRQVRILTSSSAEGTFTDEVGIYEFARGTGLANMPSELIAFDAPIADVRRVRLEAISVWSGLTNEYVGLSEVRFEGTAPAKVITPPQSATDYVNGRHVFTAFGAGTAPLTYAWYRKGTPDVLLQESTSPTFILDPVGLDSAGDYYVVVSNFGTSDTSESATLTVIDPPADITSNLLAHYTFDETSGTTAADSSGNGNNANLVNFPVDGSAWTEGRIGGALEFNRNNASNQRVTTAAAIPLENVDRFSFSFWARLGSSTVLNNPRIIVPVGTEHWVLWSPGLQGVGFYPNVVSPQPVLNVWQHYVVTYDRSTGHTEIFVDGRKRNEGSGFIRLSPAGRLWTIGGNENLSTTDPWRGALDDIRIYNRILLPNDVIALHNAGGGPIEPQLRISVANGLVTVSWQPEVTGYTLESSTGLDDPEDWLPVSGVVNNSVTLPIDGFEREFFRLRRD